MKCRRILAIVHKDLLEALRSRTILVAILLPVLASFFFSLVNDQSVPRQFNLGIIEDVPPAFARFLSQEIPSFAVTNLSSLEEGQASVMAGLLDGVIVASQGSYTAYLDNRRPVKYYALRDALAQAISWYAGQQGPSITVLPLSEVSVQHGMLPVWLTVTLTMIGVMLISGSLAEEKEKKTLDALRAAAVSSSEVLLGKAVLGVILSGGTAVIMLVLNRALTYSWASLLALGILTLAGAVVFTLLGLLIGIIAGNQAAARSYGTLVYLPLLFPALIYELSSLARQLAAIVPTFYLLTGLEQVLLYDGALPDVAGQVTALTLFAVVLLALTSWRYRKVMLSD